MRAWIAAALLLLASCASTPPNQTYSGTYLWNMEVSAFTPDGGDPDDSWFVFFERHEDGQRAINAAQAAPVHAVMRGRVEACGGCGNRGLFKHMFVVTEIVELSPASGQQSNN